MDNNRLATNIRPFKYIINIEPIGPHYNIFKGLCKIIYYGASNTNKIVLNSFDLIIDKVYLHDIETSKQFCHYHTCYDINKQQISLEFNDVPGEGILTINYTGNIYDEALGLCKVMQDNDWIFYTNFEPIRARKCFPCFDEPNFKAIFALEIMAPKNKIVLANTSTKQIINSSGKILHLFHDSPPMSTYIVAFYIGNIKMSEGKTSDGITIRVFSKKPKMHREYVLSNLILSMNVMAKIFDFKYPLDKLDLVYIPVLEGLAMENWGLITYKEHEEVFNDDNAQWDTSIFYKMDSTYTIFHEVAHQWLGNVVTMNWWSDIWLNESMATWFGWYIIDKIHPEWKPREQFYINEIIPAFEIDYLDSIHSVKNNVTKTNQIVEIFDTVAYSKGAAIISMLVNEIGFNDFMKGMRTYIKKYSYRNANSSDFINTIQSCTNLPIVDLMTKWLSQKNYPLVNVGKFGNDALIITQEVYTIGYQSKNFDTWKIPLTNKNLFKEKSKIYNINSFSEKINKNGIGFYIVNYELPIIKNILLNHFHELSNLDIAQILNDLFMTLRANKISYTNYLKCIKIIIDNLKIKSPSGLLVELINSQHDYFIKTITNNSATNELAFVLEPYINDLMNKLGMIFVEQDNIDIVNSRINGFQLSCRLGITKYIKYCENSMIELMRSCNEGKTTMINYYVQNTIIQTSLTSNNDNFRDQVFNFLFDKNIKSDIVLNNIVYTPDIDNYYKVLNLIFDDKINNIQKVDLLSNTGKNYKLNKYLWIFVKENWNYIGEFFKNTGIYVTRIAQIFKSVVDVNGSIRDDMRNFFVDKLENNDRAVDMMIEYINANTYFNKLIG